MVGESVEHPADAAVGRGPASTRFRVTAGGELRVDTPVDLWLEYHASTDGLQTDGNLWIFYDVRQFCAGPVLHQDYSRPDSICVVGPEGTAWTAQALCDGAVLRTLDLYPSVTEFLYGVHVRCTKGNLLPGNLLRIRLKTHAGGFLLPRNAIDDFYLSLVEDPQGGVAFRSTPGDRYWYFYPRAAELNILQSNGIAVASGPAARLEVVCGSESDGCTVAHVTVTDSFGNPVQDGGDRIFSATSSVSRATGTVTNGRGGSVALAVDGDFDIVTVTAGELQGSSNPVLARRPDDGARTAGTLPLHLYWGDLHGMMFNQRPLADYFSWARDVAQLDWTGGQLFSYCTSVAEVWQAFKAVWRHFDQPGRFVSLPSSECGTPPDGSHRHWFLPDVAALPPIFCEERAAAADPGLRAKFDPHTIFCEDYRALYRVVHELGGFVHGHFHTHFYEGETLAEIYQKQVKNTDVEEAKINLALRQGARLGIVAGSDTHDSRPGNPFPEPGGPSNPAGLTGVWAERLDRMSLFDAFRHRRCYATTGQRLLLDVRVNGAWMGSIATPGVCGHYELEAEILGTAEVDKVEVLVNGVVTGKHSPRRQHVRLSDVVQVNGARGAVAPYCYLRARQRDGNRAWSSPIWLGERAARP